MKDRIFIRDLKCNCIIGVADHEREKPQEVVLNIELKCLLGDAGISDDMKDTVDYRKLVEHIKERVWGSKFHLLEALGRMVGEICLEESRVESVIVDAEKRGILEGVGSVGVRVEMKR